MRGKVDAVKSSGSTLSDIDTPGEEFDDFALAGNPPKKVKQMSSSISSPTQRPSETYLYVYPVFGGRIVEIRTVYPKGTSNT